MFALAEHAFTLCLLQEMLLHMFALAKHNGTQLTFQRTLKFPLQVWLVMGSPGKVIFGVACFVWIFGTG
jgi:hypothetical protein